MLKILCCFLVATALCYPAVAAAQEPFVPQSGQAGKDVVWVPTPPELVEKITYWTGVQRPIVRGLIDSVCRTCERMKLWGEVGEEARYLVEVTALATTLAMNFLTRGQFEQR